MADRDTIRLLTLGAVELRTAAGDRIESVLAQPKRTALLAFLAVSAPRGPVSRDTLTAMFWPDLEESKARQNLRTSLHFLRRELKIDGLASGRARLELDPETVWCDAVAFDRRIAAGDFEEALRLYGGDFLAGVHVTGCREFERWQEIERARLERVAIGHACRVAEEKLELRAHAEAERLLCSAAGWAPFDERVHRALVRTLVESGERGRAVGEHQSFRTRLREELETDVSTVTVEFVDALLSSSESSDGSGNSDRVAVEEPRRSASVGPEGPVVEAEIEALDPEERSESQSRATAPPDEARSRVRPGRRGTVLLGAGLVLAAVTSLGTLLMRDEPSLDPNRILVAFDDLTADSELAEVGRIAADWVRQGLLETGLFEIVSPPFTTHPDDGRPGSPERDPVELARSVGAGTVITGSVDLRGDSIYVVARGLATAESGDVRFAIRPTGGPKSEVSRVLDDLRSRIVGAMSASALPPTASPVSRLSSAPRYEAYRAFMLGVQRYLDHMRFQAWTDDWQRARRSAYEQFRLAADLDTTFARPVLWELAAYLQFGPAAIPARDALARAEGRRVHMSARETALLDAYAAFMRYDWEGSLIEWRRLRALEPGSFHLLDAAKTAIWANQPAEARDILLSLDRTGPGLDQAEVKFWGLWTKSHHMLGLHGDEIEGARQLRRLRPGDTEAAAMTLSALAALGDSDELRAFVTDSLAWTPNSIPFPGWALGVAARELRLHGHDDDADTFFARADEWYQTEVWSRMPALRTEEPARYRGWLEQHSSLLMAAGRFAEAYPMFEELYALTGRWSYRAFIGRAAAELGRDEEARAITAWLEHEVEPNFGDEDRWGGSFPRYAATLRRAQILAALGDSERSVGVVREALALGLPVEPHALEDLLPDDVPR